MNRKGFTLIELVMVIAILAILAAFAVPKYINMTEDAENATCQGNLAQLRSGLAIHRAGSIVEKNPGWAPTLADVVEHGEVPTCPIAKHPYIYDPITGQVTCDETRHSGY